MRIEYAEKIDKPIQFDKPLKIYPNGIDNLYAEKINKLISESPTASQAISHLKDYIFGKGWGDCNDFIVNSKGFGTYLGTFGIQIAESIAKHKGVFILLKYAFNREINKPVIASMEVLEYSFCRFRKQDDNDNISFIAYCEDWSNGTLAKKAVNYSAYYDNETVLKAQIKGKFTDGEITEEDVLRFNGQIAFFSQENTRLYPKSRVHTVQNSCSTEAEAMVFKNRGMKKGFFGAVVFVTSKTQEQNLLLGTPLIPNNQNHNEYYRRKDEHEKTQKEFSQTLKSCLGSKNVGGVIHIETDEPDIDKSVKVIVVDSNINPDLFEKTEQSERQNILIACNNLPLGLIKSDMTMFGQSGEAYKQMKLFFQENTYTERMFLDKIVRKLMQKRIDFSDKILPTIIPLIEEPKTAIQ